MTGKNNEKYMDVGLYKYNNSFQKVPDPFCRQKLQVVIGHRWQYRRE